MRDYGSPARAAEALLRLVANVSGTEPVLAEHVNDHDEVLPHLLMADLGRWFVRAVAANDSRAAAEFLAAVEVLYASEDFDTRNVAEVSFMELLVLGSDADERAAVEVVRKLAGPKTLTDLKHMETPHVSRPRPT